MKPLVLCILDGVGIRKEEHGNAVKKAKMPTFDRLMKMYPHSLLDACGTDVGLPKGQMGNSEVGHTNIGAGRIVYQPLEIINKKIENKEIGNDKLKKYLTKRVHILGLLSDGGIHSNINHLFALMDEAKKNKVEQLYIHIFTDGRDTLPDSSLKYIKMLEEKISEINLGVIASISGRYYAMDRDNNYDRTKKVYDILTNDVDTIDDIEKYINDSYKNEVYDEFIIPAKITNKGTIKENDSIITFNFRPDRLRQLFSALTNSEFKGFENNIKTNLLTMFPVSDEVICENLFNHTNLNNCFGPYIDSLGLKQLRIAETEKYAHVTYFFDGGVELDLKGSNRILIPSPKVKTYDLKPEMSAIEITKTLINELDKDKYDVVILNYANGDMVGHTGDMEATIKALEVLDQCLEKLYKKVKEKDGTLIVTADHGNSDYMLDDDNNKITSHSMSKVPFIITNKKIKLKNGKLSDIAPTMLELLKIKKPSEMTGKSLIEKKSKKIFMNASIFIFFVSLIFYSARLIHFYKIEHTSNIENELLADKIINENNLTLKDSSYIYKGNNPNNYIYYSNQLFRIVEVNDNKEITLITDDNITSLVYSYENNNFKESYVNKWLEENYQKSLVDSDLYLEKNDFCVASGKTKKENCKKKYKTKIGMLSYYQYKNAGANNSYLNINKYYWLITPSQNSNYYVFEQGGINDDSSDNDNYHSYGIRPVIKLKKGILYKNGDGTKENPYRFTDDAIGIGSYINYGKYKFRIYDETENSYKLVMSKPLEDFEHIFSSTTSEYKKGGYDSLYYYLNNNFYNKLDKKLLVENETKIGEYNSKTKYDYSILKDKKTNSSIGLLSIEDLFNNTDSSYLTSTVYDDDQVIVISKNGSIFYDDITEENNVRPTIQITKKIKILSGSGVEENPYEVQLDEE